MSDPTRWRTRLHLMPPTGWLNDPNGLCRFGGAYHVFFQYRPDDAFGTGSTGWGHYTSPDLLHWTYQGMPLQPDQEFDRNGVYSGSALIDGDTMRLYYTGNVKQNGDYDYTYAGREANVVLVESQDGMTFGRKELLLSNVDYPSSCTCHVRDPKVWKDGSDYYMVLGARFRGDANRLTDGCDNASGCASDCAPDCASDCTSDHASDYGGVLLYHSFDGRNWQYCNTLTSPDTFGYMWECPDTFFVGGTRLLSISPQGLERENHRFQNIYQSGYYTVTGDITGAYELADFKEWDMGFDFYAPQTFCDDQGRRILIGWMGLPDIQDEYSNPTVQDGWQHILTLPREIFPGKDGAICQRPVAELEQLRRRHHAIENHSSIPIDTPFDLIISPDNQESSDKDTIITLYDSLQICYSPARKECSMQFQSKSASSAGAEAQDSFQNSGYGRTIRRAHITEPLRQIRIIGDTSAAEVFFGDGELVMSTRVYPDSDAALTITVEGGTGCLWEMECMEIK